LLQHSFARLQDGKPQSLCQYSGRVLLVVNTASYCGYTGQFEGLEALNARYASKGLVVLGFPSNDFRQEDPDAKKTAEVCFNTYGVKFPMFTDTRVRGRQAHPMFAELAKRTGAQPSWNFNKYLVGRDGQTLAHFESMVAPDSRQPTADRCAGKSLGSALRPSAVSGFGLVQVDALVDRDPFQGVFKHGAGRA
jgi:glutathione peroxidase